MTDSLTDTDAAIVLFVKGHPGCRTKDIAAAVPERSLDSIRNYLLWLRKTDSITFSKAGKAFTWLWSYRGGKE